MFRVRSSFGRIVSILSCFSLLVAQCGAGVHAAWVFSLPRLSKILKQQPSRFSDAPTQVYLGENPDRDEAHRGGLWTDEDLYELGKQVQENQEEWGAVDAATSGRLALISFIGSGAGEAMPWERSFGDVDTSTGNKQSTYPIVSWPIRGGGAIDYTLYHSSKSNITTGAGYAWKMSYDATVAQTFNDLDQLTGANVYYDDGTIIHFTYHATTPHYTPPAGIYDALVQNTGSTWTLTRKDQTKWNFDANGYSTSWVDRAGNTVTIGRNGSHLITQLTDPTSRQLTITYDGSNRLSTITDPTSRLWTISHDTGKNITDIAYPSLGGTIYHRVLGYDARHNITSETDLRGKSWAWAYDTNDTCTSETDPLSHTTGYSYTSSACTMTLPGSQTFVDNYSSGLIASRVDGESFSESYSSYNTNHLAQSVTDKRGKVWAYTYDSAGNVLTKTDPLSHVWTLTYNSTNDLLTVEDPLSHTTTMTYNSAGKLLTVTDPLSRVVQTNTYDSYGQKLTSENAMNEETDYGYGTHGDLTTVTDPLTKVTTMGYDTLGRLTSVEDPLSHTTSTAYDEWGRPTTTTFEDTTAVSMAYDREGHVTSVTDENGHTTTNAYDDAGRLTSTTNARSDVESYGYNSNNWRTSVTNGRNYTRNYTYTDRGEVATLTMPDSTVESWSYSGNGDVSAYTNQLSDTINYTFDDAGRETGIDYPTGTDTSFGYDNANRRTSMVDASGTTSWTYDNANEVTEIDTPQGTIDYTYEDSLRRATMDEDGVGTTTYGYDDNGHLTSVANPFTETTAFTYDDAGRMTRKTFDSGAYEAYGYDVRNRVTSIDHKKTDNSAISSESYGYDDAGNLTSKTVDSVATTYTYDNIDQLLSESRTGYSASYTYDANGNRATKTLNSVTDTYTNNNVDELTGISQGGSTIKSFTYDDAGRTESVTTGAGTTDLDYDYEGRLTTITYPNTSTNTFEYNGLDTRVSKTDSAGTADYLRDGVDVTDPVINDGTANYTPGDSERRSGSTSFVHSDQLGSTTRLTNSSETTTDTREYDAFGVLVSSTGSTVTPLGFAAAYGYQSDSDSGLMLLGHRYYDCSIGRFITRDKAKDGRNWYDYAAQCPTGLTDPDGLEIKPPKDPTARRNFYKAQWYLLRDDGYRRVLKDLWRSKNVYEIEIIHNGDDHYDHTGTKRIVAWDPYSGLKTKTGNGRQTPALGLGHELDHAWGDEKGKTGSGYNYWYDDNEEKRVITGREKSFAKIFGETPRFNHGGQPVIVNDPLNRWH